MTTTTHPSPQTTISSNHSASVTETAYLTRRDGRVAYDVAGDGPLLVLLTGMGDLRAAYRFLAPALRHAGYRVACTDLRGHGDSDTTFTFYGDEETAEDTIALIEELGGPAVVIGPFVRNGKTSTLQRLTLRVAMARPWAAMTWKAYLPKLYAGQRPADFDQYRDQLVANLRRPGYAKAFSLTTRTDHTEAQKRLSDVSAPTLVVMAEQDPDFPDPRAEAEWIAQALNGDVVIVPEAGHYPQSQQPELTAHAVVPFLETINGHAPPAPHTDRGATTTIPTANAISLTNVKTGRQMITTTTTQPRAMIGRAAFAVLGALLLALLAAEAIKHSTGYWQIAAFGFGPDLPLFFGVGRGLARGQIHPHAVELYNIVHGFWGPIALAALAALGVLSVGFFIGALTWGFHIALDRALGYGLRTRDGYQRP